jgi:bromodomain-containing protein 4
MGFLCFQLPQMTQQQQKNFISSLSMSLEQPPPGIVMSQSSTASSNTSATPTSQLMQQLTLPLDIKPPPVNNPSSSANKPILIPNAVTQAASVGKTEMPQPSPTGNNNKSNINLNHMNQQQPPILAQNPMGQTSVLGMTGNGGMQSTIPPPITTSTSLIHQQLTNNNTNSKHPMAAMNSFDDPLEQSLASMEQPQMNNNSQKNNSQDMNAMLMDLHKQQMLLNLNHMAAPNMNQGIGPNGFGGDFNGANGVNNLMNMLVMPQMDPQGLSFLNPQMKPNRGFPEAWQPANNPMMQSLAAQQQQQQQIQQQQQQQHHHHQQKQEKIMLTPKPIEELLMNPNDKSKGLGAPPAFSQAFNTKYEQNLKNASSWSQLAAAGSPQNPGNASSSSSSSAVASSKTKVPSDTFQEYRTKAKEQAQRQKQEQEKIKKQKEQQELKRQQESLQKHKTPQVVDDLSNGHRYVTILFLVKQNFKFFLKFSENRLRIQSATLWKK